MLKSMTGFGRCENATDEYKISVEMKAVHPAGKGGYFYQL